MSPLRFFGLVVIAMWLAFALYLAASDVAVLSDPRERAASGLCSDDLHHGLLLSTQVDNRTCLSRVLLRGGRDAALVGVPILIGWAILGRRVR
jgi:hypothetical protein